MPERMTVPASVFVNANEPPDSEITPVEKVAMPPLIAVRIALLFRTILPVKVELWAELPPIVAVPVLPD